MNFKRLRYFLEVVEAGSLSKAAAQCNVVQSALSQQIAILEQELGHPLLIRSNKGIAVSHAGQLFARHAKHILQQVEYAKAVLSSQADELVGQVSIGFPTSTATSLSALLLEACLEKYPGIQLRIFEGLSRDVHQALSSGSIDAGILFTSQQLNNLTTRTLYTEELFIIKSAFQSDHISGTVGSISAQALMSLRLLLPERGNGMRDWLDTLFYSLGYSLQPKAEVASVNTILRAVERGVGASILPWGAFANEECTGKLAAYRIEGLCIPRALQLCTLKMLPVSAPTMAVISLIQVLIKEQIESGVLKHAYQ